MTYDRLARRTVRAKRITLRPRPLFEVENWRKIFRQAYDESFVAIGRDPLAHMAMDHYELKGDVSPEVAMGSLRNAALAVARAHRTARRLAVLAAGPIKNRRKE